MIYENMTSLLSCSCSYFVPRLMEHHENEWLCFCLFLRSAGLHHILPYSKREETKADIIDEILQHSVIGIAQLTTQ